MKTIVIIFALLCAACAAGEIIAALADENDEEDEDARQDVDFMGDCEAQNHETGRAPKPRDR